MHRFSLYTFPILSLILAIGCSEKPTKEAPADSGSTDSGDITDTEDTDTEDTDTEDTDTEDTDTSDEIQSFTLAQNPTNTLDRGNGFFEGNVFLADTDGALVSMDWNHSKVNRDECEMIFWTAYRRTEAVHGEAKNWRIGVVQTQPIALSTTGSTNSGKLNMSVESGVWYAVGMSVRNCKNDGTISFDIQSGDNATTGPTDVGVGDSIGFLWSEKDGITLEENNTQLGGLTYATGNLTRFPMTLYISGL